MRKWSYPAISVGLIAVFSAVPAQAQSEWGPGGVPAALEQCEAELDDCLSQPCIIFPGDGWTGAPLLWEDHGDGTFTDLNTGLMWETKTGDQGLKVDCTVEPTPPECADVSDVNNCYNWSADYDWDPDGLVFTFFLVMLNGTCGGQMWGVPCDDDADCAGKEFEHCGLAGHTDWRLPTAKELMSLVDFSVDIADSDLPGSKGLSAYWSSTENYSYPWRAWTVRGEGWVDHEDKTYAGQVRAVRDDWGG